MRAVPSAAARDPHLDQWSSAGAAQYRL